jgi:hypothetical protein
MTRTLLLAAIVPLFFSLHAAAEVVDADAVGFTCRNAVVVPVSPAEVYARLVGEVGSWWSSDHTFSGDAANLRIDDGAEGCFCETLPGGGVVRHLTVVHAAPGKLLPLRGGLGPLQGSAVTGAMSWELAPSGLGTAVTLTYAVGGYAPGGLDAWAPAVDRVVGEQLDRLARFVTTGSPETPADEASSGSGGDDR